MLREEIEAKLKPLVESVVGERLKEDWLTLSFAGDLGFDSIDSIELVIDVEAEFDIEIPDRDCLTINTVGAAVDYLVANLG